MSEGGAEAVEEGRHRSRCLGPRARGAGGRGPCSRSPPGTRRRSQLNEVHYRPRIGGHEALAAAEKAETALPRALDRPSRCLRS